MERRSYPVMTPSAAVGVLAAIFAKPEFAWVVRRIDVHAPIRYDSLRMNELQAIPGPSGVDVHSARQTVQRTTTALRNVRYTITAHPAPLPAARHSAAAYADQLNRRVRRGACFRQPCLGLRDFEACFEPANPEEPVIDLSQDLGLLPLRVVHQNGTGPTRATFFPARLERGRLHVPEAATS